MTIPTDRWSLVAEMSAGHRPRFVPFWHPTLAPGTNVGPGVLCQWWEAAFKVDGLRYPTAEHWMMAEKARLFGDRAGVDAVLAAATPAGAKALGRAVRGFDGAVWRQVRTDVVVRGNLAKFGQLPDLAEYLLSTEDAVLVEASPVDTVWGVGLEESDTRLTDPARWRGENLLGFALMAVRDRIRGGDAQSVLDGRGSSDDTFPHQRPRGRDSR